MPIIFNREQLEARGLRMEIRGNGEEIEIYGTQGLPARVFDLGEEIARELRFSQEDKACMLEEIAHRSMWSALRDSVNNPMPIDKSKSRPVKTKI